MSSIHAVRGFNDILPATSHLWSYLENIIQKIAVQYGYQEIRLPILEKTELFVRGVGEITDIVEKEIYSFQDRNQEWLSLRPEGTAGAVRAAIEHGLLHNQIQRLWYRGPMFRYERPQAGRYRQFYQVGFEFFGEADPYADAELILLTARLWKALGVDQHLCLEINSLGTFAERHHYKTKLVEYFTQYKEQLDADSVRRLDKNPLRILDSKNPAMQPLIEGAPKLVDYLTSPTQQHFESVQNLLRANQVAFTVNPRLVRGLDYYTHTVFEWTTTALGAQGTLCAGGRYNELVEQLGGKSTAAIGFAMGLERVLLMVEAAHQRPLPEYPWIYLISLGEAAKSKALGIAEKLRDAFSRPIVTDVGLTSLKSQIKRADKSGAELALIIGEEELKADTISIKFLRQEKPQINIATQNLIDFLERPLSTQL